MLRVWEKWKIIFWERQINKRTLGTTTPTSRSDTFLELRFVPYFYTLRKNKFVFLISKTIQRTNLHLYLSAFKFPEFTFFSAASILEPAPGPATRMFVFAVTVAETVAPKAKVDD
jgi:hypothetical protein